MADNTQQQAQTLTLNNGNAAQNQYLGYYNQLINQLNSNTPQVTYQNISVPDMPQLQTLQQPTGSLFSYYQTLQTPASVQSQFNYNLPEITAPTLAPLQQMTAQTVEAPQLITPQTIQIEEQNQEDLARQVSAYLRPYTENAINARRAQTGKDRAAADVDASSRGMGSSTWLSDAKNRMAAAEASDITAMENEYLGNLGQQVFTAYQNYLDRAKDVATQNAMLDYNAQNANVGNQIAVNQFNANALMNADQYNTNWANQRASEIGKYNFEAQQANNQQAFNLLQLAQQAASNDIANQMEWAGIGMNAYGSDLDRLDAINQYNTTTQNNALMAYWEALANAAQTDKQNEMNLALANRDFYTQLMQLAMGYAGNLSGMVDLGGGGGGGTDNSGITYPANNTISQTVSSSPLAQQLAQQSAQQSVANILATIQNATAGNNGRGTKPTAKQNLR